MSKRLFGNGADKEVATKLMREVDDFSKKLIDKYKAYDTSDVQLIAINSLSFHAYLTRIKKVNDVVQQTKGSNKRR